jgi:hypothetical protein
LVCLISNTSQAQRRDFIRDNQFKILVGYATGAGVGYEYNVYTRFNVEGVFTTLFSLNRIGLQAKYTLIPNPNYKIKAGLETTTFMVSGTAKPYAFQRFTIMVLPHLSFEMKDLGFQFSLITPRDLRKFNGIQYFADNQYGNLFKLEKYMPMISIVFNVSKSDKPKLKVY